MPRLASFSSFSVSGFSISIIYLEIIIKVIEGGEAEGKLCKEKFFQV